MSNDAQTIGKYKLVNCLASGQSSQVWEVIDNETTRRAAMKLLLPEAIKDPEQLGALKHEFKVGSSFEHPNIIKYHEVFAKKQTAYFTMDLFAAPNLKSWAYNDLRGIHIRFKRLVETVAMALEHVHERGWLHRDIKPDNILMNKSAEVRVIDFSLASRAATTISKMFARKQATVQGTRTYMAPEQILGRPLTPQTDIYNLGVTLFELLTGQAPFAGSTPKDILLKHLGEPAPEPSLFNPNVTPEMDRIILRMLAKKPDQRQKKVSEFLVEFRNVNVFKEPVTDEAAPTEREAAEEALKKVLGGALDSRADALRTKLGIAAPVVPKKKAPPAAPPKPAAAPAAAAPPAMPQPQPQMMPGMMMPMQPMMPMPMAPYPMQPGMPGMPMPGGGPSPWVSVPAAPWMGQPGAVPPPMMPGPVPGQPPQMAPPPAARPAPPPVAPAAVPQVATRPAAPPPAPPAAAKPRPAPPRPAPKGPPEGMKIDDLLGFDDLPPV